MYEYTRSALKDGNLGHNGPYEAMVISHLDRYYQGTLLVELIRHYGSSNVGRRSGQLMAVRYVSPFYGVTPYDGLNENDGYQNTQKSYGFWAVPPDFGTRVLVIFAESSGPYGYWIGCIQDANMNFMTPGGVATSTILTTDSTPEELQGKKLPVGEYNKLIETGEATDPTLFKKPYNKDFTEVMQVQGLLNDEIRGTTTSSARREIPSMVFGISTPGPLDKRKGHSKAKYGAAEEEAEIPFNRLGGSSFVMDDGDDKFVRATHAEDGPPIYLNREAGEQGGDETIPQNELIRLRTRTGHQILMHNSEDLIYIANSRGTAWLEFTSDGKIDIYAYDSISLHTDNDFNLSAERDINMEAGRNVNIAANDRWSDYKKIEQGKPSGVVRLEGRNSTSLYSAEQISFETDKNFEIKSNSDIIFSASQNIHLNSQGHIYETAENAIHQSAGHSIYRYSKSNINDKAEGIIFQTADGSIYRKSLSESIYDQANSEHHIVADSNIFRTSLASIHDNAESSIFRSALADIHDKADVGIYSESGGNSYNRSGGDTYNDIGGAYEMQASGDFALDAANVYLNSGLSFAGEPAVPSIQADPALVARKATGSNSASGVTPALASHTVPYVMPGSGEILPIKTSIPRVPQHEPWPHHENLNPLAFKKHETDIEYLGRLPSADRILTPDTFAKGRAGVQTSVRIGGSGGNIETGTEGSYGNDGDYKDNQDVGTGGTVGAGPIPGSLSQIKGRATDALRYIPPNSIPSNIVCADPTPPQQHILDIISLAAKTVVPNGKLRITPKGGAARANSRPEYSVPTRRTSGKSSNHHPGHAADIQIIDTDGKIVRPRDNKWLFTRLAEELISYSNERGYKPGIGSYSNFMHFDEKPTRGVSNSQDAAITWNEWSRNNFSKTAEKNYLNNKRTAVDRETAEVFGVPQTEFPSGNINDGNASTTAAQGQGGPATIGTEPSFGLTAERSQSIRESAERLGANPNALAGILSIESNFDPSIQGGASNRFYGIFQLQDTQIPGLTQQALGRSLTPVQYQQISFEEQLRVYETYVTNAPGVGTGFFTGDAAQDASRLWALQLAPSNAAGLDYNNPLEVISRTQQAASIRENTNLVTVRSVQAETLRRGKLL